MYKSKLQELCQKRGWDLPDYLTTKQGLIHEPRFKATVKVNGLSFETPNPCKHLKEAHNDAAMVAYFHFTDTPISPSISATQHLHTNSSVTLPLPSSSDAQHIYKNQLQTYAQKGGLTLPEYSCEREGPPHASRYRCKVTVAEITYESPESFSTLKEAEHAAAKVALMSLSQHGAQDANDHAIFYKNILQELAQKEGFRIPIYTTNSSGLSHTPIFVSTVEVEGQLFQGEEAKSKKQAEMNAAKVAYIVLKEGGIRQRPRIASASCQSPRIASVSCQVQEATSSILKSTSTVYLQENVRPKVPLIMNDKVVPKEDTEQGGDLESKRKSESSSDAVCAPLKDPFPSVPSSPQGGSSSLPIPSECTSDLVEDPETELLAGTSTYRKVCVYPRMSNMQPLAGKILFSDDNWVAVEIRPEQSGQ